MSQRMMLQFSAGALFLLLPLLADLALGELSNDFNQCLKFFYNNIPPSGFTQYQPICQRYENQYRFATLYHREYRVPVYSAYILSDKDTSKPTNDWKYEPQLVSKTESAEMKSFPKTVTDDVRNSQAVPADYESTASRPPYTRGHLAPGNHQETDEDREATYTLTNIVPQTPDSNDGTWSTLEKKMKTIKKQQCTDGKMYVITGAVPYNDQRWLKDEGRVSIPEYMWTACCCTSYKHKKNSKPVHYTYAAVGRNDPNSGDEIVRKEKGYDVREMPLQDLEKILQTRLNIQQINLFDNKCGGSK